MDSIALMDIYTKHAVAISGCDKWFKASDVIKTIKAKDLEILLLTKKLKTAEFKIKTALEMANNLDARLDQFEMKVDEMNMLYQNNNQKLRADNAKLAGQLKRVKK